MTEIAPAAKVVVAVSDVHGRGVFARTAITVGETIERCPVLRLPAVQRPLIDESLLYEYYFEWRGDVGIALGFGSLYNHSGTPNAEYHKHLDDDTLVIRAIADIGRGEEITFSYSGPAPA